MKKSGKPFFQCLLFAFLFSSTAALAQVTGHVADSTGQSLLFCNVMLVKTADSSVVTGTTTNETGNFTLEKKDTGNFRLLVLYSGYNKYYSPSFTLSDQQPKYDAGKIVLQKDANVLDAVQVVAQKPFMEQKMDRTVFNIENSVIASGNNALDILRKLPGVTVDNSDNIQVRGKPGVLFMIDGRVSYLSSADMANYLRSIDGSQVEKIEVITNPSSKYDASGNAIINIVLKKNKNMGLNAQVNGNYEHGLYGSGNGGITTDYRTKKWNLFATENYYHGLFYEDANRNTTFKTNGVPNGSIDSRALVKFNGHWNYARAGADFMPNDKQTIGIAAERSGGSRVQDRLLDARMLSANNELDSSQVTHGKQKDGQTYYTFDLNYKYEIDTLGKELTADLTYAPFSTFVTRKNVTDSYNSAGQYTGTGTQRSELPTDVSILAGKVDYTQPFGKKIKIETGAKGSLVSVDNDARYFNVVNGTEVNDTTLSNHFIYSEGIYSAYFNYNQELSKKLGFQLGFRGEETQSEGTQLAGNTGFTRKYFKLFPTAFVNWKIDSTNTLNFSYSRRIDRPDYEDLNPFKLYQSPFMYNVGNPYLHPQMSDNYELTHIFRDVLSTSFGFMHMTNVYNTITHQDAVAHVYFNRLENLSTYNVFNLMFAVSTPVTPWLSTVSSANFFRDHYFGTVPGGNFSAVRYTWIFSTLNTITLGKGWSLELSYFYRSMNQNGVWREMPVSSFDAGVKKSFANGKGTVSLNCSDIFRTGYQNSSAVFQDVDYKVYGHMDNRRVRVSASWKFGKSQYQRDDHQKSGDDELNRAK